LNEATRFIWTKWISKAAFAAAILLGAARSGHAQVTPAAGHTPP
jgi:hypothetical protein